MQRTYVGPYFRAEVRSQHSDLAPPATRGDQDHPSSSPMEPAVCSRCHGLGHLAANCGMHGRSGKGGGGSCINLTIIANVIERMENDCVVIIIIIIIIIVLIDGLSDVRKKEETECRATWCMGQGSGDAAAEGKASSKLDVPSVEFVGLDGVGRQFI